MKINFKQANNAGLGAIVITVACYLLISLLYLIFSGFCMQYVYVFTGDTSVTNEAFYPEWLTRTWQGIGLTLLWLPYIVFFGLEVYFDKRSGHKKTRDTESNPLKKRK